MYLDPVVAAQQVLNTYSAQTSQPRKEELAQPLHSAFHRLWIEKHQVPQWIPIPGYLVRVLSDVYIIIIY